MTEQTNLRRLREGAYGVDVVLDDHLEILSTSLLAVEWDRAGDRLLYERQLLRWQTVRGTGEVWAPEGGPPPYRLQVEVAQLPRAGGDLSDAAQGTRFALVETIGLEAPPEVVPRQVTCIAAEPESGAVAVFSVREPQNGSPEAPYQTTLQQFSRLGQGEGLVNSLDNAGAVGWPVCSAAWGPNGSLYAVQANDSNSGRSFGRVVRHDGIGNVGVSWDRDGENVNPVALAIGGGRVWVLVAALIDPPVGESYFEWSLAELTPNLDLVAYDRIDFDLEGEPVWSFAWPGSSAPELGGGNLLWDEGTLISSGYSPNNWPPEEAPTEATFRWAPGGTGTWLEDLGPAVPAPLHRSGEAELIGNVQFQPPTRASWGG